jgi:hypothetical protein
MTQCFWPHHEPRIHAMIIEISKPFNAGQMVEMRLSINNRKEVEGEIVLRIPTLEAQNYKIGDVYAAHFKLVSEFNKK